MGENGRREDQERAFARVQEEAMISKRGWGVEGGCMRGERRALTMRGSRKTVEGVQLGSEVRLRCLRLSHQPVSSRLPAITGGARCLQSNTIRFSVL